MAIIVDDAFIETWHPRYDLTESDQAEYDSLIAQVAMEVRSSGTISKETFLAIWRWKGAMRVIGPRAPRSYERYAWNDHVGYPFRGLANFHQACKAALPLRISLDVSVTVLAVRPFEADP